VLVRLDHVARFIVNAIHSTVWAAVKPGVTDCVAGPRVGLSTRRATGWFDIIIGWWTGRSAQLSRVCRSSLCLPRVIWRKLGPSETFLERYVARSRTQTRSRDRTGAVVSIMKLRRAIVWIVRLRSAQSLYLQMSIMSGWRRQLRPRSKEKAACLMELRCPASQAWLPVRSRQTPVTLMSVVFRPEPKWKIRTQAKFFLPRKAALEVRAHEISGNHRWQSQLSRLELGLRFNPGF